MNLHAEFQQNQPTGYEHIVRKPLDQSGARIWSKVGQV